MSTFNALLKTWAAALVFPICGLLAFMVPAPLFRGPKIWGAEHLKSTARGVAEGEDPYYQRLAACIIIAAISLVALGEMGALLRGMHTVGKPSSAISSLGGELAQVKRERLIAHADGVVDTWAQHGRSVRVDPDESLVTSGLVVARVYLLVDSLLFVPFFAAVLVLLLLRGRNRVTRLVARVWGQAATPPGWIQFWLQGSLLVIALYVIADIGENVLQWLVIESAWDRLSIEGVERPQAAAIWALKVFGALKWSFLVVAASLGLALLLIRRWHKRLLASPPSLTATTRPLVLLRLQVILLILFAGLLILPEQAWDVPRGWTVENWMFASILTALFSFCSWEIADRLIGAAGSSEEKIVLTPAQLMTTGLLLLAVGGVFFAKSSEWRYAPWGVGIAGLFLLLVGGLSAIAETPGPEETGDDDDRSLWQYMVSVASTFVTGLLAFLAAGRDVLMRAGGTLSLMLGFPNPVTSRRHLEPGFAHLVRGSIALVLIGLIGMQLIEAPAWSIPIVGGIALWVLAFGAGLSERPQQPPKARGNLATAARVLAGAPFVFLGLAMVRAATAQFVYAPQQNTDQMIWLLLFGAIVFPVIGYNLGRRLRRRPGKPTLWRRAAFFRAFVCIAALIILVGVMKNEGLWKVTEVLGTVGVLALFVTAALFLGATLVWFAERTKAPAIFGGIDRIPVFVLLLAWMLVASFLEKSGYHDVRVSEKTTMAVAEGIALEDAWQWWLDRNGLSSPTSADQSLGPTREVTPLLLVAASGGGVRAAYWTDLVLDCLLETDPAETADHPCFGKNFRRQPDFARSNRILAASGISGGSLGLVSYAAYLDMKHEVMTARETGEIPEKDLSRLESLLEEDWVQERLDEDFLAANLAWNMFVEVPRWFLRFRPEMDRGEVLERDWEQAWGDAGGGDRLTRGFLEIMEEHHDYIPLLILNGATVAEDCRFSVSILNAGVETSESNCLSVRPFEEKPSWGERQWLGATHDLVDYLCEGQDVNLSTAALLSARFPLVSPAGRLKSQCSTASDQETAVTHLVDGGYLDTSSASTLVELWAALSGRVSDYNASQRTGCVVPFFVQIDNGYELPDPPSRDVKPGELTGPMQASGGLKSAWIAKSKQAAASLFARAFPLGSSVALQDGWPLVDRYAHIYPRAHPGVQAPLGWSLSEAAITDLESQLAVQGNAAAIEEVRGWDPDRLDCAQLVHDPNYRSEKLTEPLDLTRGWHVTDVDGRVTLYREQAAGRVAVSLMENMISEPVAATLEAQDANLSACPARRSRLAGLPASVWDLAESSRDGDYALSSGNGLRFELEPAESGRVIRLEAGGRLSSMVYMTARSCVSLNRLQAEAGRLLAPIAERTA